jgi:hypothetical protein
MDPVLHGLSQVQMSRPERFAVELAIRRRDIYVDWQSFPKEETDLINAL